MLVSLVAPMGSFYVSTPVETVIANQNEWTKVLGTTSAMAEMGFTHSSGRLTYTGASTRHFHIASTISATAAGNNKLIAFAIGKNGTVDAGSRTPRFVSTGADVGSLAVHWDLLMSTNDYIEVFVRNETDAVNVTAEALYLFALGMLI